MCGTRDAALNWEMECTEMMVGAKFKQGSYSACVYYHEGRNIRAVVHGDGFSVLGISENLDWLRKVIEKKIEVKCKGGLIRGREGAVRVLNSVVSSTKEGMEYEAGQRHAEIIVRDVGLKEHSTGVTTPGVNDESGTTKEGEVSETLYRAIAARASYLSQDRPDIQLAAK